MLADCERQVEPRLSGPGTQGPALTPFTVSHPLTQPRSALSTPLPPPPPPSGPCSSITPLHSIIFCRKIKEVAHALRREISESSPSPLAPPSVLVSVVGLMASLVTLKLTAVVLYCSVSGRNLMTNQIFYQDCDWSCSIIKSRDSNNDSNYVEISVQITADLSLTY